MTKQGYSEWRRGRAAFRCGRPFDHSASHEWKMGYINAQQSAAT